MSISPSKLIILVAAVTSFMGALLWSEKPTIDGAFISVTQARIGRPLTPMSYAGVARRTTRRAVVYGGAAAAAAAGAYVVTPGCAQVVNAYGQVYTRC
jgi:hypothetical protein